MEENKYENLTEADKLEIKRLNREILDKEIKVRSITEILPNLYAKRLKKGWRQIKAPIKKDFNKGYSLNNINWENFMIGGRKHLINAIVFFGLIFFMLWSYNHDIKQYKDFFSNSSKQLDYCQNIINFNSKVQCTEDLQKKGLCILYNNNLSYLGGLIVK